MNSPPGQTAFHRLIECTSSSRIQLGSFSCLFSPVSYAHQFFSFFLRYRLSICFSLPKHIYLKLEDGSKKYCSYDERQVGDDRLSSVQYIKFDTGGAAPVAIGSDDPAYTHEHTLDPSQAAALAADLAS